MEFEIQEEYSTHKNYNNLDSDSTNIPVIPLETTYNDFFTKYMIPNVPCLLRNTTIDWESTKYWLNCEENSLNFSYLLEKYGKLNALIYNCTEKYFNSQKTKESTFAKYLQYWKNFHYQGLESSTELQYLKDWHLKLMCKDDNFYVVPIYFASDWLNEYYTNCLNDDYRFVYMGVKGTWTPFHSDVFSSYSWSANVFGRKKWILFPPGEENYLRDNLNNLPYDVTKISHSRKHFEVIQNAGEALFVPSGWYHQVWNLEDTISVNHNWINACNIQNVWKALKDNLKLVVKEIEDCSDMDNFNGHCQTMLNASFGMNFKGFYEFIKFIAKTRLDMLKSKKSRVLFHNHTIGIKHILYDLQAVKVVLHDLLSYDTVKNCNILGENDLDTLLSNIIQAIATQVF